MELNRDEDPFMLFQGWLAEAEKTELNDPEAMALATVDADGTPSVRTVLFKGIEGGGLCFYTNMESRKGQALAANPRAALCFHWKSLRRQVRVEGAVERVPAPLVDAYFKTRHYLSRLGAWASRQSQPLESRAELESRVQATEAKFGADVPRPPHWGGYRVVPARFEFWQEGQARLHDRFSFTRAGQGWKVERLNP